MKFLRLLIAIFISSMMIGFVLPTTPAQAENLSVGCNFFSTPRNFTFGMLGGFASGLPFNAGERLVISVKTPGVASIYFAGHTIANGVRTPTTIAFFVPETGAPVNVTWIATSPQFQMTITCMPGVELPRPPRRIQLTSLCSPEPSEVRRWRVRNPFPYPVTVTWRVYHTNQTGTLQLPAAPAGGFSEVFFDTQTVRGPNTVRLFYEGRQVDVKASNRCECE
jgi:hypothetical protein